VVPPDWSQTSAAGCNCLPVTLTAGSAQMSSGEKRKEKKKYAGWR
jgi:hypothetical protein